MNSQRKFLDPADRAKVFRMREIHYATRHAKAGGVAVHVHNIVFKRSPTCFKAAVNRGEWIIHLYDRDKERLVWYAKYLGVKIIFIDREDTQNQHIDLCGKPALKLLAALNFTEKPGEYEKGLAAIATVFENVIPKKVIPKRQQAE
jgi:hypothetical protein